MEKIYYSISEVSRELRLRASVLRFWEEYFPDLEAARFGKSQQGTRHYTKDQIDLMRGILHLRDKDFIQLKGIQKIISEKGAGYVRGLGT